VTRGLASPALALGVATAGGVSSALSNAFGAYVAETAVANRELSEYAKHTGAPSLNGTAIAQAYRSNTYTYALTMGTFVLLGALVPMLPIIFLGSGSFARVLAVMLSMVTLFALGAYTGARSKGGLVPMGIRTSLLGLLVTSVAWAISQIISA
jgi:predicted membrane protein (TIGR00267 family)